MPNNTSSWIERLSARFPHLRFRQAADFYWSPSQATIFYRPLTGPESVHLLLHEAAHALLNHRDFTNDIQLLGRERDAWTYARTDLAPQFATKLDEDIIQDHLDTYRDWLARRSRCPECAQTGLQTGEYAYKCLNCACAWKVNDARFCRLRRYVTT